MNAESTSAPAKPAAIVTKQPSAGTAKTFIQGVSMPANANPEHQEGASRVRGGGAARGICDCIADIICCPCEMMGI
ncbi:hypothetical protein CVT26_007857 [Gymnopilus dilepis]|uniref:Uncharacterized protein n=1 Tax=Gymnopilus dilepis TaxID=231916 RepID=A0A409WT82_9AGAR|nr:hypothetical protein CVT26_007857 [Gymnopilus dilepis]